MPKAQKNRASGKKKPLHSIGAVYGTAVFIATLACLLMNDILPNPCPGAAVPMLILGILVALLGLYLWYLAAYKARIDDAAKAVRLMTEGIYARMRHPMYVGLTLVCSGALLCGGNLFSLIPIVLFFPYLMILLPNEEKPLQKEFGREWEDYAGSVPRFFPLLKRSKKS